MIFGADTGLLFALLEGNPIALTHWQRVLSGQDRMVLSTVCVTEILVHAFRRGTGELAQEIIVLLQRLDNVSIEPVTLEVAERAARYRHGLGLSTADAMILATAVLAQADALLTRDSDFRVVADQQVMAVQFLQ